MQTVTLDEAATIAAGFASALGEAEASQAALAKYSAEEILAFVLNCCSVDRSLTICVRDERANASNWLDSTTTDLKR